MSQELQKRDDARAVIEKPVLAILRKHKNVIETIAKGVLTEERVFRLINAAITRTPDLLECSPISVLNSILHITYLGLEVAPEQAYLLPFRNRKEGGKKICTPVIDYRGKIRIAAAAGILFDDPEIVYSKDKFRRWTDEGGKHFMHEEAEGDRGEPIGAYSLARWQGLVKITYMHWSEINAIKTAALARTGQSGPWKEHELEMAKKTTVHRAFKTLPRPANPVVAEQVQRSQEIDDAVEMGEPVAQIIEGSFEEEQPFLAAGSAEAQEKVLEQKLSFVPLTGAGVSSAPASEAEISPEESRRLDAEAYEQQQREELARAAANQPKPTPKVRFGRQA